MTDPSKQIKKVIYVLFIALFLVDLVPRIMDPESHIITNTKNQTSTDTPQSQQNTSNIASNGTAGQTGTGNYSEGNFTEGANNATYNLSMKTMNIMYCASGNFKKTFEEINNAFSVTYPTLIITGSDYPVPQSKALLAKLLTIVQYALYALIFAGPMIFGKLGIAPPAIYTKLTKNKVMAFFIIMTVFGQLHNMVGNTGAFEVELDNRLVYSKLQTGKLPTVADIDGILRHYIIEDNKEFQ